MKIYRYLAAFVIVLILYVTAVAAIQISSISVLKSSSTQEKITNLPTLLEQRSKAQAQLLAKDQEALKRAKAIVSLQSSPIRVMTCSGCSSRKINLSALYPPSEKYAEIDRNGFVPVSDHPESTFSIDVDTGSYTNIRRLLNVGQFPPKNAVRIEEMINYFNYEYPIPDAGGAPFSVTHEVGTTPWNKNTRLIQIGLQGYEKTYSELPPSNLVFLIDVSGSMLDDLSLIKESMRLLAERTRPEDTVGIVTYSGTAQTLLEPTSGAEKEKILHAIDQMKSGGSTNGGKGIQNAYRMALQSMIEGGINRVLLATDGDFNVGVSDTETLIRLIENHRELGVSLSTLGFGWGNYNDELMEQLADKGNGNYAYIDSVEEANRVLVEEMSSTLFTIAKDVKVQIEFNPTMVSEYRLIGYENRSLERKDFSDDKVDAGEIGAGHNVTALYEVTMVESETTDNEPRRYVEMTTNEIAQKKEELAYIRIRYKQPDGDKSILLEQPIPSESLVITENSDNFNLSAAVAGFGQLLSDSQYLKDGYGYRGIRELLKEIKSPNHSKSRREIFLLLGLAEALSSR